MALWACTDVNFLSRPKSGSVAGCSVGLGDPTLRKSQTKLKRQTVPCPCLQPVTIPPLLSHTTPFTHNASLHVFCQRMPVVVASVAEAEYAATFGGGQVLVELTLTLTNLGHPQQ
jgi:hypothetical protein